MKLLAGLLAIFFFMLPSYAFSHHAVNINTADKAALETLTGIGPAKAQAIIDYRTEYGPFATIEDIQNVSGIGPATYSGIRDHITVSGGNSSVQSPSPSPPSPSSSPPAGAPPVSSYVAPPEPMLFADAGEDRTVIAGADAAFRARAYNRGREIVENVRFSWNFGDGSTAEGQTVLHRFAYPGRYAVVLIIAENKESASDTMIVTAVPAELSFSTSPEGAAVIENRGAMDLDLSRWIVHAPAGEFFLPMNSIVLAGQTVRIPQTTLGFFAGTGTELRYPNGTLAFRAGEIAPVVLALETVPSASHGVETGAQEDTAVRAEPSGGPEVARREDKDATTSSQYAAASASGSWKWWGGALALALFGAGAVYISRRYARQEWAVIDDTSE